MTNYSSVQKVNISDIIASNLNLYSDGDIILFNTPKDFSQKEDTFLLNFVILVYCEKGKVQLTLNDKLLIANEGDLIISPPHSSFGNIMISPETEIKAFGISDNALKRTHYCIDRNTWNIFSHITHYPLIHTETDKGKLFPLYYDLLSYKIEHHNNFFYKEIMQSLLNCLYNELRAIILPLIEEENNKEGFTHGNVICQKFFELLGESEGRERSVAVLAENLCITPKYLSTIVKEVTGNSAIYWTHLFAIKEIERQLKYSNKSIKEISNDMLFPNISFFGKFVKTHLGVSPTQFRKQMVTKEKTLEKSPEQFIHPTF